MERKNGWLNIEKKLKDSIMNYCDDYIKFLNCAKTEREAAKYIESKLINAGFVEIDSLKKLNKGDKVYYVNRHKSVYAAIIGENVADGLKIVGAHIDSPRLDLKPNPLYEKDEQALLKTHYYGGIKKYQWTTIPLSLRGVIVKNNGDKIDINIGDDDEDIVFTVTDLLPHLSQKQSEKKIGEAIVGENLNILVGSASCDEKDGVKKNILNILKDKYNIEEADFVSSEIEVVPAFKAKSLGFDRSMVAAYGQDDRVCAYNTLMAITEVNGNANTNVAIFADKEEIGSYGNTGMMSEVFDNFMLKILIKSGVEAYCLNDVYCKSKMLSADVGVCLDANYEDVSEPNNSSYLGHGVELNKYTGSRGKSGCSDANAEFVGYVRNILETNNIAYQVSELGKVDLGGGGTIAYILANKGMDVIDCGVPILSMHSPYEVSSKFDVYMTYLTYLNFYKNTK